MSFMRPDPTKETSCKTCVFAIYDGKTQTGCLDNRIEKFKDEIIEAYDDEKEFYVIKRICNLFRNNVWNDGVADFDLAKTESAVSFDLLIDCSNIDEDYSNKIISSLKSLTYSSKRIKIVLYHSADMDNEHKILVSKIYKAFPSVTISMFFEKRRFIHEFLMRSRRNMHIFLNQDNVLNVNNVLDFINDFINTQLKKMIICKMGDWCCVSNGAYKFISTSLSDNNYENILEKMVEGSKEEGLYIEI